MKSVIRKSIQILLDPSLWALMRAQAAVEQRSVAEVAGDAFREYLKVAKGRGSDVGQASGSDPVEVSVSAADLTQRLEGLPEAIGTMMEFPVTTAQGYMGIDRSDRTSQGAASAPAATSAGKVSVDGRAETSASPTSMQPPVGEIDPNEEPF